MPKDAKMTKASMSKMMTDTKKVKPGTKKMGSKKMGSKKSC